EDERNLPYMAAQQLFSEAGVGERPLRMRVFNRIPVARGLGFSGAGRIAGMLVANALMGEPMGRKEILDMAAELEGHPDNVVASMVGGVVVSCLTEEGVRFVRIEPPPRLRLVLAIPEMPLETQRAREALPERVPLSNAIFNLGRCALLVAALAKRDFSALEAAVEDRLHQPYREGLLPFLREAIEEARKAGARGAALAGAGPTVVALTDRNEEEVARSMSRALRAHGVPHTVKILEPERQGARVEVL
ncbi:MAG TPA: homoserine kinase, partial [Armatimonadetes bacterium]|nr:homoserine kinase [Armatimonadota bacterium]